MVNNPNSVESLFKNVDLKLNSNEDVLLYVIGSNSNEVKHQMKNISLEDARTITSLVNTYSRLSDSDDHSFVAELKINDERYIMARNDSEPNYEGATAFMLLKTDKALNETYSRFFENQNVKTYEIKDTDERISPNNQEQQWNVEDRFENSLMNAYSDAGTLPHLQIGALELKETANYMKATLNGKTYTLYKKSNEFEVADEV